MYQHHLISTRIYDYGVVHTLTGERRLVRMQRNGRYTEGT